MTSSPLNQDEVVYWESARGFVRLVISQLNDSLKAHRVSAKKRREICATYAFSFCNFLDQQWFKPNGRTQYPLLCFSESFFDVDTQPDLSQIVFPNKAVEFHAMVDDEVSWFFEEVNEVLPAPASGDVGAETADVDLEQSDSDSVIRQDCSPCGGSGQCFCLRRGSGDSSGCPRCRGDGKCRHCQGTGYPG